MINLLPPDLRSSYRYAHINTYLARWTISLSLAILGLLVIGSLGYLYISQTSKSLDSQITNVRTSLKEQNLDETKKQTEDISNSIKLSVSVLSKEILFSKLLRQIAAITPNNTVLVDLNINQSQAGLDITSKTANYNAATQLQVNLTDPNNKLFQKADIISITCSSDSSSSSSSGNSDPLDSKYPCTTVIRALFVEDNPYLFINNDRKAKP